MGEQGKNSLKELHGANSKAFIVRRENAYFIHFMTTISQSCPHLLTPKGLYPFQQ